VAGEDAEGAVAAALRLHARRIRATFDLLGEDVRNEAAARRSKSDIQALLRAIPRELDRNVSIKLTMMGLDISSDLCFGLVSEILDVSKAVGGFVRLDMEGSKHTQPTIDVFHRLRRAYDNVGIVLQAYLRRTEDDIKEAISRKDRVRICKGAYKEPPTIAFVRMDEIRENFRKCAWLLLKNGDYPAIATHDENLVRDVVAFTRDNDIAPARFEFQMLYGLRPKRWDELVATGHNVRVYVPFGTHWLPYFYRRLRERKENVFFVLKSLLGG